MTSLEKILDDIKSEAEKYEKQKDESTHKKAVAILEAAKKEAEAQSEDIIKGADSDAAQVVEKIRAATDLEKRKILLKAKHDLIESVINSAKEYLLNLPSEEYFNTMLKLIEKNVNSDTNYTLIVSSKDKARIPEDFQNNLDTISKTKNSQVHICDDTANISGGFILENNGIEQNYSIDAMFEQCREELFDILKDFLFARK